MGLNKLRSTIKNSLESTKKKYYKNPELFLNESDIRSFLYMEIFKKLDKASIINTEVNCKKRSKSKGTKGRFDIMVTSGGKKVAIEIKFGTFRSYDKWIRKSKKDLKKLNYPHNELSGGFYLIFLKNSKSIEDKIRKKLERKLKEYIKNKEWKNRENLN